MKKLFTFSKTTILCIMLVVTFVTSNINLSKDNWKSIIEADAKGYYAYLPAVFIYKDLNFSFFDHIEKKKYYNENLFYDYRSGSNGKIINKYYIGTAIAELPAFLLAHGMSYLVGNEMDGYSKLYPTFINLFSLIYLLIGLILLNKILLNYQLSEKNRSFLLLVTVFGTNLFYYAVVEPGLSHIYSFTFVTAFIYYAQKYFEAYSKKYTLRLFLLLGIIVLIRPVNILLVLALPFLAGSFDKLKFAFIELFKAKTKLFLGLFFFFIIASSQLIIYKISTGSFFVYSYGEEGFNYLQPHFIDILFSYKKGLFLYTPYFLIALVGLITLWNNNRFLFWSWLGFFIILTYIFSSWWNWWYGGSFSSRVYVEFIPFFCILLAITLRDLKQKIHKRILITSLVLVTIICQIQTFQYRYFLIHWEDMNKEKYWDNFLRIDKI